MKKKHLFATNGEGLFQKNASNKNAGMWSPVLKDTFVIKCLYPNLKNLCRIGNRTIKDVIIKDKGTEFSVRMFPIGT